MSEPKPKSELISKLTTQLVDAPARAPTPNLTINVGAGGVVSLVIGIAPAVVARDAR